MTQDEGPPPEQQSDLPTPKDRVQRAVQAIKLHLAIMNVGDVDGTLGQLGEHQVFFTGMIDLQELALEALRAAEWKLPREPEVDVWNYPSERTV
ncbi:hypothetical protein [Methylobacterium platani]|uniref:Uncharacterized protein n=2 Tax=Methylobacterium platani TaxID=427683 RepID=A0A179SEL2_9HYPH|nr:hypothetical protein [Methylobacterium platani]KMO21414.1 hypothetical protein SQ03_03435 [Methylobacterium platani JCM 14648]OAS26307.1 hypothetical protein A5481_06220 [Methylobacterium platani]